MHTQRVLFEWVQICLHTERSLSDTCYYTNIRSSKIIVEERAHRIFF